MKEQEYRYMDIGSIVLQYVNDSERFVGVVVGNHMIDKVNSDDRNRPGECHTCLVLGYFDDTSKDPWSMFIKQKKQHKFPFYSSAEKRLAVPADLSKEVELHKLHLGRENEFDRLNPCRSFRTRIFGFSGKQKEILGLVSIIQHYMNGGDESGWPAQPFLFQEDIVKRVFDELRKAIPRP